MPVSGCSPVLGAEPAALAPGEGAGPGRETHKGFTPREGGSPPARAGRVGKEQRAARVLGARQGGLTLPAPSPGSEPPARGNWAGHGAQVPKSSPIEIPLLYRVIPTGLCQTHTTPAPSLACLPTCVLTVPGLYCLPQGCTCSCRANPAPAQEHRQHRLGSSTATAPAAAAH